MIMLQQYWVMTIFNWGNLDNTEFTNQVLKAYFEDVGITHQTSTVRTRQQNRAVERKHQTLVEATRTMLIFSNAPLFLWADVLAIAWYTQNLSLIHKRFNKTPYELINNKIPNISFLHVFGALCYPKNDHEDIRKLGVKGDIDTIRNAHSPPATLNHQTPHASTTTTETAPKRTNSSTEALAIQNTSQDVDKFQKQQRHFHQKPAQSEAIADNANNVVFDDNTFIS
nr:retrovirus-related Pol polyprotein from transposon TNT 1-94 [Tanacetum cinerariifolium]